MALELFVLFLQCTMYIKYVFYSFMYKYCNEVLDFHDKIQVL